MTTSPLDKDTLWTIDHKINDDDETMVVISSCPHCGAPLYAPNTWLGPTPPPVVHTCECRKCWEYRGLAPGVRIKPGEIDENGGWVDIITAE